MKLLFAACLLIAATTLFTLGSHQVDPDLFWHLRAAELIQAYGARPFVETFSYFSISGPWVPYSWLAELFIHASVTALSATALYAVPLAALLASLLFVILMVVERIGPSVKAAIIVLIVCLLILPFLAVRPAVLTFPFCAYTAWALMSRSEGLHRAIALAIVLPITALLANIHLYFLFPPLLLGVWGVGGWLDARRDAAERRRQLAYVGVAAAAVGLALFANPFGFELVAVIRYLLLEDVMIREGGIIEMLPFFRMTPLVLVGTSILILWPAFGMLRKGTEFAWRDLVILVLASVMVIARGRYVPLATFMLAPLAASYAPWPRLSVMTARKLSGLGAALLIALAVTAVGSRLNDPAPRTLDRYLESRSRYPVAAVRFVADSVERRTGRLINEMGWAGYLIYALWPDYQVMLDGRTNRYPAELWRAVYLDATRESQREVFRSADADAAVLRINSPWAEILESDLGWELAYEDGVARVWIPR